LKSHFRQPFWTLLSDACSDLSVLNLTGRTSGRKECPKRLAIECAHYFKSVLYFTILAYLLTKVNDCFILPGAGTRLG